jgi:hypothetical protein
MRCSRWMAALLGVAAVSPPLAAQEPRCSDPNAQVQAACNAAVDAYVTFQPLAGLAISGGNPELGTARVLGGMGHLFVSVRVNIVKATVPNPDTTRPAISGGIPAPVVEAGVGIWPGLSGGLLSIDALGSATLLPTGLSKLSVDSTAARIGQVALGVGYGVRVGVLKGSFPIPSVSVSVMRRTLPRLQYGSLAAGDQFEFATDLRATNVRVAASLRLINLDAAAGFGFDRYSSSADLRFYDNPPLNTNVRDVPLDRTASRSVLFVNAGLDLLAVKLVGELGYQTGKGETLSRTYANFDPTAGHVYGGVGLRFSF